MNEADGASAPVILVLGSPADKPWGERITTALEHFGLSAEVKVASAHKTPEYLLGLLREWEARPKPHVYITVAGRSNALSAFIDAQVASTVISCPPSSDAFGGMDILSSLRMPRGVAPLVVLEPENAVLAAAKILSVGSEELRGVVASSQATERERVMGEQA